MSEPRSVSFPTSGIRIVLLILAVLLFLMAAAGFHLFGRMQEGWLGLAFVALALLL